MNTLSTQTKIRRLVARRLREIALLIEDQAPNAVEWFVARLRRIADQLNPPKVIAIPNARIFMSPTEPGEFKFIHIPR